MQPRPPRRRYDPCPWAVRFAQLDARGRASRPYITNARGRRVRAAKPANAVLMGAAPELYEALEGLADQAAFLLSVLRSDHPLAHEPADLERAKRLLRRLRLDLLAC
jgi:hypothetical protein